MSLGRIVKRKAKQLGNTLKRRAIRGVKRRVKRTGAFKKVADLVSDVQKTGGRQPPPRFYKGGQRRIRTWVS